MATSIPIYSSVLLAPGATPTSPVTVTTQFPLLSNFTNLSSSTGNFYFNFVITTGTVSTGPSAYINLRYIFSSNPNYSLSSLPLTTLANASTLSVQVTSTLSIVRDFTSSVVIPIEGPYLYTWIDISNFQNPVGLSVNAYSANELSGGSTGVGVTSVGLSVPSIFSVANTPITSNGTIVVTANAQNANTVLAGPSSGGSGTPTFRNLVAADFGFNLTGNDIIACLGASLTLGTGSTGSNYVNSWPAQLSQNFSNTYVYNYGVSGSVAGPVGTANSGLAILAAASPSAYQYRNGSYSATTTSTLAALQATAAGNSGNLYVFVDYGINDIGAYSLATFIGYIQSITSTLHGYGSNVRVIYNTPTATATIAPQAISTFANALIGNVNQTTQTYSASKADYLNDIGSVFTDSSSTYLYSGDGINPNNQGYALIAQLSTSVLKNHPTTPQSLGYIPKSLIVDADDLVNAIVLEGSNRRTLVNASGSIVANWNSTDFQLPYLNAAGVVVNDSSGNLTTSSAPTISGLNLTALPTNTSLYPTLNQNTTGNALTATTATTATNFSGSLSGDVTGTQSSTNVVALNGTNLANLATGLLKNTHTTGVPTIATSGTDYAPATSGSSILYGNGSGGFSNVTIGTGLSFSGGALSASGSGTVTSFSSGNLSPLFTTSVATATSTPALSFSLSNAAQNSVFGGPASGGSGAPSFQTAPTISGLNLTALPTNTSLYPTLNQNTTGTAAGLSSILVVASGGTGTSTPGLVAGSNITVTGTWPNQTIAASSSAPSISAYSLLGNNTSSSASGSSLATNILLGVPSVSDSGVGLQQTSSVSGYFQHLIQNTSSGTSASTDVVLNNNSGTSSSYYINLGINSSGYAGSGSFNIANAGYIATTTGDLVVGTTTSNAIHFVVNGASTDTFELNTSGQLVVPAFNTAGLVQNNSSGVLSSSTVLPSGTTATTQSGTDNSTKVATTAFVAGTFAPLASPSLTGTPTAPTATAGTSTTQIATTAFVNTSYAPLASPTFTGTPAAPTATAGTNTTQLATTAFVTSAVAAAPGDFKNRLMNGDMRIYQRGTTSVTSTLTYFFDRWYCSASGANLTLSQSTPGLFGFQNALQLAGASSNTGIVIGQRIEAANIYDLAYNSSTVTLSVYLASSSLTSITVNAYTTGATLDNWSSRSGSIASHTWATVNSTLTQYTYSFSLGGYTNGIEIEFTGGALTNGNTFTITGVQLEAGSTATSFERLPVQIELAQCQRYYYQCGGVSESFFIGGYSFNSSTLLSNNVLFPQPMRVAPNYALSGSFIYSNASAIQPQAVSSTSAAMVIIGSGAGNAYGYNSSGSYLTFADPYL